MIEEIEHTTKTGTLPAHDRNRTTGAHDHRKREDSGKAGKPEYICMIIDNEKKVQKKVKKKFGNKKKSPYLCSRNQTTNKFNYKITKQ